MMEAFYVEPVALPCPRCGRASTHRVMRTGKLVYFTGCKGCCETRRRELAEAEARREARR